MGLGRVDPRLPADAPLGGKNREISTVDEKLLIYRTAPLIRALIVMTMAKREIGAESFKSLAAIRVGRNSRDHRASRVILSNIVDGASSSSSSIIHTGWV